MKFRSGGIMQKLYAQDGVNVAEGDDFSSFAAKVCKSTYGNSPFVEIKDFSHGHFRGPRGVKFVNLPADCYFDVAPDGIGTKVVIITAALSHHTAARDVLAMTCADISRWGGLPLLFSSVLDVATLGNEGDQTNLNFRKALTGLVEAADEQGIVLYKGETAELGACVGSDDPEAVTKFNWAGFAVGVYHDSRIINGDSLEPGQRVIALREHGFRSNGISSVRKALKLKFGDQWWNNPEAMGAIQAAARPSILYDKFLAFINGWLNPNFRKDFQIHSIVHVTGGGIKSKFAEDILFPRGLSADLTDLWDPPEIMRQCAEWRGMSEAECYEAWNGGQGMLIVVDEADVKPIIDIAGRVYGIEAKECGQITQWQHTAVALKSRFGGEMLAYELKYEK